jgi:hypothetical protein
LEIFFPLPPRFLRENREREEMEESDGVSSTQTAAGSDTAEGTERSPVAMLINSSEFRTAGFKLKEVFSPTLEAVALVHARSGTAKS